MDLSAVGHLAALVAGLLTLAGLGYAIIAIIAVRGFTNSCAHGQPASAVQGGRLPSVTILKPLHGDDPELLQSLRSFCVQDYDGPIQIVCGVSDERDPSVLVVDAVRREHPKVAIALVRCADKHGTNNKISNIINMMESVLHDVVVLSDSDIRVDPQYLRRVIAPLGRPEVGAVTSLYRGVPGGTLWTELLTLAIEHHFLPSVLAGRALGMAEPCMGSTVAMSRETLDGIGGFSAFRNALADDYEVGRAVRALGLRTVLSPGFVVHVSHPATLRELLDQELRWQRTIRVIDPAGFAGSIVTHILPLSILSMAFSGGAAWSCAVAVAAVVVRRVNLACVDGMLGWPPRRWGLWIVRDILSFVVFLTAFWSRKVVWRGHHLDVNADGTMRNTE